jgi:hypothetical protein
MKIAIVDIETTGFLNKGGLIAEVGIILLDLETGETECIYEELVKEFGKRVADLVLEVTHEGLKGDYGFFFPRLKSKEAILIKLVDRASNVSRMQCWSEKRQQSYLNKTKFWKDGSGFSWEGEIMKQLDFYDCSMCDKIMEFKEVFVLDEDMPSEYYMCKKCYK